MSKELSDLISGRHIPKAIVEKMEQTEPGMLSAALESMVYARSHDKDLHSVYPEKVYIGNVRSEYMAKKLGIELASAGGAYVKSDLAIRKVIDLLDALALQHALENR